MNPSLCQRLHSEHEANLEEAVSLAAKAEAVHRQDDAWPHGLSDELEEILDLTVAHQQREQAVVFPMLMTGVGALPARTINDMIAAHKDILKRWRRLHKRTAGFAAPSHACATWRRLYFLCQRLDLDCRAQVEAENRMLLAGRATNLGDDPETQFVLMQRH